MMADHLTRRADSVQQRAKLLEARWRKLCALYLPRAEQDSFWRSNRGCGRQPPPAGWKLHLPATILNAHLVLRRVAPLLIARGVPFKAPGSLVEVGKLNAGLDYGYSQIGKIITVYPRNESEAVTLAQQLHKLTRRLDAPSVPFDIRFSETSNVYYRFGAFQSLDLDRNGQRVSALYAPDGTLVPDVREQPKPNWVASDPFAKDRRRSRRAKPAAGRSIRVLHALSQRGKGGVYVAVDFSPATPKLCLLKEGRKNGEVGWDGRDGAGRIRNEERVLKRLSASGVSVPKLYASFQKGGNYYLVMEYLDGETLHQALARRRRRLTIMQVLVLATQLAEFISQMHRAGWAWRDCKPKNIIMTRDRRLVPIDFEGAGRVRSRTALLWATRGFTPPRTAHHRASSVMADDAYALGSVLFLLLTGRIFEPAQSLTIQRLRRNVPPGLCDLVQALLDDNPETRPTAAAAMERLSSISLNMRRSSLKIARAT